MISAADIPPFAGFSVPATIANWKYLTPVSGTWTLTANGATVAAASSSICQIAAGGFPNQRITASMKFITPTVAGGEDISVLARYQSNFVAGDRTFYMLRQTAGEIRLVRVLAGTFTTLASAAFALAQDTFATFILTISGSALTGYIDDGSSNVTLNATDTNILNGGFAIRSGPTNSTVACRSFTVEQVA